MHATYEYINITKETVKVLQFFLKIYFVFLVYQNMRIKYCIIWIVCPFCNTRLHLHHLRLRPNVTEFLFPSGGTNIFIYFLYNFLLRFSNQNLNILIYNYTAHKL